MNLYEDFFSAGIVKKGHFKLTSGDCSDLYINKDEILLYPRLVDKIAMKMISLIHTSTKFMGIIEFIASPAVGAIPIGSIVANGMSKPFVYPEKIGDKMVFRRGFPDFIKGKKGIIIEDIVTTGKSLFKVHDAIRECGGVLLNSFCIWDIGCCILAHALIKYKRITLPAEICPLCRNNVLFTNVK